jgi:hypothetical protein
MMETRKIELYKVAYHLARRSVSAGFWFLAFCLSHDYRQIFEIVNAGLAQVLLGDRFSRTKGWTERRNDRFFEKVTRGSEAFWKGKVKKIFLAIKELNPNDEPTELTV